MNLIKEAIKSSSTDRFLIDGFPRCEENRIAFETVIGVEPDLVLFFDCPEEEMVKRVLGRNQGRIDDNIETIKKRLKVFELLNLPVINYYSAKGKVYKINATGTVDEIFEKVRQLFGSLRLDQGLTEVYSCPTCRRPLFLSAPQRHAGSTAEDAADGQQLAEQFNLGLNQQGIPGNALPVGAFPDQQQNPSDAVWSRGVGLDSGWVPSWSNTGTEGAGLSSVIRSVGLSGVQMSANPET